MRKHRNNQRNYNLKNKLLKKNVPKTYKDNIKLGSKNSIGISGKMQLSSTSTKSPAINDNSNNSGIFLRSTLGAGKKKSTAKKQTAKSAKPFSSLEDTLKKSTLEIGTKAKDCSMPIAKRIAYKIQSEIKLNKRYLQIAVVDLSYQFGQKGKYQELIRHGTTNIKFLKSFSKNNAPVTKLSRWTLHDRKALRKSDGKAETDNNKSEPRILAIVSGNNNPPTTHKVVASSKQGVRGKTLKQRYIKKLSRYYPRQDNGKLVTSGNKTKPPILTGLNGQKKFTITKMILFKKSAKGKVLKRLAKKAVVGKKVIGSTRGKGKKWTGIRIQSRRRMLLNLEKKLRVNIANGKMVSITELHTTYELRRSLEAVGVKLPPGIEKKIQYPELIKNDNVRIAGALNKELPADEVIGRMFGLTVYRSDIRTLDGLNWLNDTIINVYMNLMIERGKMERVQMEKLPKLYAMNTFFYTKLSDHGYDSVRRWTRGVDIFNLDLMFVPIHTVNHWSLCSLDFRKKKICHLDSVNGSSATTCTDELLMYLQQEHQDKKKSPYDTDNWLVDCFRNVPLQKNNSDCGVFLCTLAEAIARDGEVNFTHNDGPYLRRKMILEILDCILMIQ